MLVFGAELLALSSDLSRLERLAWTPRQLELPPVFVRSPILASRRLTRTPSLVRPAGPLRSLA
jgi:hypothetical protein